MKALFLILVLASTTAYSQDPAPLTLEERVSALEKTINEPVVLEECDLVPIKIKEGWASLRMPRPSSDSERPYVRDVYVPYQTKQQILIDSKIYTRLLNKFFIIYNVSSETDEGPMSDIIKSAGKLLKLMRQEHQLCSTDK